MLLLRLAIGIAFVAHGWVKFADMDMTVGFFGQLGFPAIAAYAVAAVELLGGLALIAGLWTDLAAMLVALVYVKMVKFGAPFLGGYELDFVLLAGLLAIVFNGPGKPTLAKKR